MRNDDVEDAEGQVEVNADFDVEVGVDAEEEGGVVADIDVNVLEKECTPVPEPVEVVLLPAGYGAVEIRDEEERELEEADEAEDVEADRLPDTSISRFPCGVAAISFSSTYPQLVKSSYHARDLLETQQRQDK